MTMKVFSFLIIVLYLCNYIGADTTSTQPEVNSQPETEPLPDSVPLPHDSSGAISGGVKQLTTEERLSSNDEDDTNDPNDYNPDVDNASLTTGREQSKERDVDSSMSKGTKTYVIDGVTVYNQKVYSGSVCHKDIFENPGEIKVPDVPTRDDCNATDKAWSWTVHSDAGYLMDITLHSLEVNHEKDEFLMIGEGTSINELWENYVNPIFTAKVTSPKHLRVMSTTGKFTVLLVTNTPSGFKGNFRLTYEKYGDEITTPETTEPTSTLPPAPQGVPTDIRVYLGGLTPEQFGSKEGQFKTAVADMANKYCEDKKITLVEEATEANVILLLITRCPVTWPDSSMCVHVNMSVTVITPESDNPEHYELTAAHLRDMWNTMASTHPGLGEMGLHVYEVPDPDSELFLWLGVSIGVLIVFLIILIAVYRLEIFKEYTRMTHRRSSMFSTRSSVTSNDSWFPTTHQQTPPFLHADAGYIEYEPEFNGPVPIPKDQAPPLTPPPNYDLPSYGPPQGYGGAVRFFGNTPGYHFNTAFEEEDEDYSRRTSRTDSNAEC